MKSYFFCGIGINMYGLSKTVITDICDVFRRYPNIEKIEDLGLLYKVDVVDYHKNIGTPIGEHIKRVGKSFYNKAGI